MTTEENQSEDPFRNNDSSYKKSNNTESLFWNRDQEESSYKNNEYEF